MSKTGDTKRRIYDMLKSKNSTMTDISKSLGLAPSTVTQHLQEMEDAGMISLVRSRKLKYYEVNEYPPMAAGQNTLNIKRLTIPIAIVALLTVFGFSYYILSSNGVYANAQQVYVSPGSTVPAGSTVFTISDTPTLYNITALFITVENVSIHSQTTGKWYSIPLQTSTFDLIKLKNISTILSGVELKNGTYNELKFSITKVEATVNGTDQSVFLPSNSLRIFGKFGISNNGATNWINIDFDLEHSLHVTPNGSIIMLPVLNIRHNYGSSLELNQTSIIISNYPGRIRAFYEFGMDANGTMAINYTTPQNWSMTMSKGRLEINETGNVPIIIRDKHDFIIGNNANAFFWHYGRNASVNDSWSANQNVTLHDRNGFRANCMFRNGAFSCEANRIINPSDIRNIDENNSTDS